MFKAMLKGIKSFFTITEDSSAKITRKHGHTVIPGDKVVGKRSVIYKEPIIDTEKAKEDFRNIQDVYLKLDEFNKAAKTEEEDALEAAKLVLFNPLGITDANYEHILQNCGYTKDHMVNGIRTYDPRLYSLIRLSMNVYLSQISEKVDKLALKLER